MGALEASARGVSWWKRRLQKTSPATGYTTHGGGKRLGEEEHETVTAKRWRAGRREGTENPLPCSRKSTRGESGVHSGWDGDGQLVKGTWWGQG